MTGQLFPLNDLDDELESLLRDKPDSAGLTRRLFELAHQQTQAADPVLAGMMRACAIPRWFDAEIIGVLRAAPDEAAANTHLLEGLLSFNFVLERQDGGYTCHDNTRQALLEDWQQPDNRPLFETYQNRLATFYIVRGKQAYQHNNYQPALAYFNLAIELHSTNGELYYQRGRAYLGMGDYSSAKNDLEKAISLDFSIADTYFAIGVAHYYLNNYPAAIDDFSEVIKQEPNNATAYYNRGATYSDLKQHERAIAGYNRAIELNPEDAAAYNNRGLTYRDLKQHERAIADYNRAIELNPEDATAYHNRGLLRRLQGDLSGAVKDCETAYQLRPNHLSTQGSLVGAYMAAGQNRRGQQLAQEVLSHLPETDYYQRACLEALLGHNDAALDLLERSLQEDPSLKEWARQDPDWLSLHSHPGYRNLVGLAPLQ